MPRPRDIDRVSMSNTVGRGDEINWKERWNDLQDWKEHPWLMQVTDGYHHFGTHVVPISFIRHVSFDSFQEAYMSLSMIHTPLIMLQMDVRVPLLISILNMDIFHLFLCFNPCFHIPFCPFNMTLGECNLSRVSYC